MEMFVQYFTGVSGILCLVSSQFMNTKNMRSALYFKVIPMIVGIGLLICSAHEFGVI